MKEQKQAELAIYLSPCQTSTAIYSQLTKNTSKSYMPQKQKKPKPPPSTNTSQFYFCFLEIEIGSTEEANPSPSAREKIGSIQTGMGSKRDMGGATSLWHLTVI